MKFLALSLSLSMLVACDESNVTRPKVVDQNQIQGVAGSSSKAIRSQLHRSRGTNTLSVEGETLSAAKLPVGYDDIPLLAEADDGRGDSPVVRAVRPNEECGLGAGLATLSQRLRDCATKNPLHSEWKGLSNGNAGEGSWKLVARDSNSKEIWFDETTGLIWSDVVNTSSDWCKASGNTEGPIGSGTIDCAALGTLSRCAGQALLNIPASEISWRLPTRNDFLQADLNGARFVLRSISTTVWTATVNGDNREEAWAITPSTGLLTSEARSASLAVRCVGRRLK